jgi:hypothetical protein
LFHAVETSEYYTFDTPPRVFRARVTSYALGAYKVFVESIVVETSEKVHSTGNSKG